ncbi:rod shape-determining protein MreD [Bacillaceae bacterium S4-13-58]
MKRAILPLLLLVSLILESIALEFLPNQYLVRDFMITPHWIFVMILYIAIFYDSDRTYMSVLYGITFGFLVDILYTDILGVYMFTYGIVAYVVHGLKKMLHANFFVAFLLSFLGLLLVEWSLYIVYTMTGVASMGVETYMLYRLIPTMTANLIFMIILYPFFPRQLYQLAEMHLSKPKKG